jgi:hypothetical protein
MRILNESGRIRANELVNKVIKRVGNEKMIYREISSLVESGEIEKKMHSKSHIEYELVNLSEMANHQLKDIHREIEVVFEEIKKFNQNSNLSKTEFQMRLRGIIHLIHIVQSIDGVMKLLSDYPTFKKDKMFSQITRKIDDCWKNIIEIITQQPEEEFFNEVITNIRISDIDSRSVN